MRRLAPVLALLVACGDPQTSVMKPAHPRGMIVLGIDGMDPQIVRSMIARGGISELATTSPPQSPVAWSTFVTGEDSDHHGIYDFVHRDALLLAPYLSTSKVTPPAHTIELGSFALPLGSPEVTLLRDGTAFWQLLERHGVPATVVKVPANFPPPASTRAESMSGMGTPDLLGTYGTFQLVTDDPIVAARPVKGGIIHRVDFAGGQRARTTLTGPADPLSAIGTAMALDVELVRDVEREVVLVRLGDRDVMLAAGEWSDWQQIAFDPGLLAGDAVGMVRLYLRQVEPLHLYVSPINLDPRLPAMPLSAPSSYVTGLARDVGPFYTQGMPEDTKAYASGVLTAAEFLAIVDRVMRETESIFDRELARFRGGLLFVYLSSIDQASHVFFRSLDPSAPAADRVHADVLPGLYRRVDDWIGRIAARLDPETRLVVMSDHGFAPYRTKVHLNAFLARRGYLAVLPPAQRVPGVLGHVDWQRTQAYALGLNQVFVNLRGREARGIVDPAERAIVLDRLERDLYALRDPDSGETAITRLDRAPVGRFVDRAPDLVVGYRRGYRSSDESALGAVGELVFEPNHDRWSGDHCMDPAAVPGVLISSTPLVPHGRPALRDLAPTILEYFGVPLPGDFAGRSTLAMEKP